MKLSVNPLPRFSKNIHLTRHCVHDKIHSFIKELYMLFNFLKALKPLEGILVAKWIITETLNYSAAQQLTKSPVIVRKSTQISGLFGNYYSRPMSTYANPERTNHFKHLFSKPDYNLDEIEDFLQKVPRAELSSLLKTEIDDLGLKNTALHLAVTKKRMDVVELLMSFDASTKIKNSNGETPASLAKKLSQQNKDQSEYFKDIECLIKSRESWQEKHLSTKGIHLNYTLRLLESCAKKIKVVDQDLVLFTGITQRGKSTLVNYTSGTNYSIVSQASGGMTVKPTSGPKPRAATGDFISSKTLYPQICNLPTEDFSLVDMPGISENRGTEESICTNASVQFLLDKLGNHHVRGLVMVCSAGDLVGDGGLNNFRKISNDIRNILPTDQILLVVSQTENRNDIKDLKNIILNNLNAVRSSCINSLSTRNEKHKDYHYFNNTIKVADLLLADNGKRIVISNILTPDSRAEILEKIRDLDGKHSKVSFNLDIMKKSLMDSPFKEVAMHVSNTYFDLLNLNVSQKNILSGQEENIKTERKNLGELIRKRNQKDKEFVSINNETHKLILKELLKKKGEYEISVNVSEHVIEKLKEKHSSMEKNFNSILEDLTEEEIHRIPVVTYEQKHYYNDKRSLDEKEQSLSFFDRMMTGSFFNRKSNSDQVSPPPVFITKSDGTRVEVRTENVEYERLNQKHEYVSKLKKIGVIALDASIPDDKMSGQILMAYEKSPIFYQCIYINRGSDLFLMTDTKNGVIEKLGPTESIQLPFPLRPLTNEEINEIEKTEDIRTLKIRRNIVNILYLVKQNCSATYTYHGTGKITITVLGDDKFFGEVKYGLKIMGYKRDTDNSIELCERLKQQLFNFSKMLKYERQVLIWRKEELTLLQKKCDDLDPKKEEQEKIKLKNEIDALADQIKSKESEINNLTTTYNQQVFTADDLKRQLTVNQNYFDRIRELLKALNYHNDPDLKNFIDSTSQLGNNSEYIHYASTFTI